MSTNSTDPGCQADFDALTSRIADLAERVERLEKATYPDARAEEIARLEQMKSAPVSVGSHVPAESPASSEPAKPCPRCGGTEAVPLDCDERDKGCTSDHGVWPCPVCTYRCHAGRDGDCVWPACPQLRDGEPSKSGRHCPLDCAVEP